MQLQLRVSVFAAILLLGCPANPSGRGDEVGECMPGTEACSCIEGGLCVEGLVCASDLCVDLGSEDDEEEGEADSGPKPDLAGGDGDGDGDGSCVGACGGLGTDGSCLCTPGCTGPNCCADYEAACGGDGDGDGDGDCFYNDDCASDEVCAQSGSCVAANGHSYTVYVDWADHTPDCIDFFEDDCLGDIYLVAWYGGSQIYQSGVEFETVEAYFNFEMESATLPVSFVMAFYDYDDLSENDLVNSVCSGAGACGVLTAEDLHGFSLTWAGDFPVSAYFVPH